MDSDRDGNDGNGRAKQHVLGNTPHQQLANPGPIANTNHRVLVGLFRQALQNVSTGVAFRKHVYPKGTSGRIPARHTLYLLSQIPGAFPDDHVQKGALLGQVLAGFSKVAFRHHVHHIQRHTELDCQLHSNLDDRRGTGGEVYCKKNRL